RDAPEPRRSLVSGRLPADHHIMGVSSPIRLLRVVLLLGLLGVALYGLAHRQGIADWWRLRGYHAPPAISAFVADDRMTGKARDLFYLNRPQLLADVAAFRQSCPLDEESIVLGCYQGGQRGIAIFAVHDPRLDGVEQVTAAHEMLHAAY